MLDTSEGAKLAWNSYLLAFQKGPWDGRLYGPYGLHLGIGGLQKPEQLCMFSLWVLWAHGYGAKEEQT